MSGANYFLAILLLQAGCSATATVNVEIPYLAKGASPHNRSTQTPGPGEPVIDPIAIIPITDPDVIPDGIIPGSPGFLVGEQSSQCATAGRLVQPLSQEFEGVTTQWCWSAGALTLMKFHAPEEFKEISPCDVVTKVLHNGQKVGAEALSLCCSDMNSCQQNGRPERALGAYDFTYGHWFPDDLGPIPPQKIATQLCENGPFNYVLLYGEGGGGHVFSVRNIRQIGEEIKVEVHDHIWNDFKEISYEDFKNGLYWGSYYIHEVDIVQIKRINR